MMLSFWLITILLCVIAALFIAVPLLNIKKTPAVDQVQINLALYRQRLQALQEELQAGLFTQEQLQLAQVELQRNLLLDTDTASAPTNDPRWHNGSFKYRWGIVMLLVIAIPIIAYPLYWHLGAYRQVQALVMAKQNAQAAQALRQELGTPDHVIALLKQHLAQNPDSAQGWFLLGKLYASRKDFAAAAQAFAKADQLQPNNPAILFQYAQALYITQRSLQGKPTQLLQQLLKLQPENALAKNLIAVAAFERGDYQAAINTWEALLPHYPAGSPDQQALLNAIAKAQLLLKKSPPTEGI